MAAEFSSNMSISILRNGKNLGAMGNIWKSLAFEANTPYLMSLHQDDFLKTDYLERAIALLENDHKLSFVLTGPEWVPRNHKYAPVRLESKQYEEFTAAQFAYNALHFVPYMFGSVVYHVSDRSHSWDYETYNLLYCDRYYLGSILAKQQSKGAFLCGKGIFECDHTQDEQDNRSPSLNEDHAIALMSFYKDLLLTQYSKMTARRTNLLMQPCTILVTLFTVVLCEFFIESKYRID